MTESYLSGLREKAKNPAAIFHRFRATVPTDGENIYFVEGYEDCDFYGGIARVRKCTAKFYICFGKKNLDEVRRLYADANISGRRVIFVRDRDYDFHLGRVEPKSDLFLTCGYSVENYVCNRLTIMEALKGKFGVNEEEVNLEEIAGNFEKVVERFFLWLERFHALAFEAANKSVSVDLNKLDAEKYISIIISGGVLPEADSISDYSAIGFVDLTPSEAAIKAAKEYMALNPVLGLRGKFLLALSTIFIRHISNSLLEMHRSHKIVHLNKKACANISGDFVFSILSSCFSPTPPLEEIFPIPA